MLDEYAVRVLSSDLDTPTLLVPLRGIGTPIVVGPDIAVLPTQHQFLPAPPGGSSWPVTITITNHGDTTLTLASMTLSDANNFTLDPLVGANPCQRLSPQTLASDDSCTVGVVFTPQTLASHQASLTVQSDDPDEGSVDVALSGVAIEISGPLPKVSVSHESINFGKTIVNRFAGPEVVRIENTGEITLNIVDIALINQTHEHSIWTRGATHVSRLPGTSSQAKRVPSA